MAKEKKVKSLKERLEATARKVEKEAKARAAKAKKAASAPPVAYRPAIVTFIDILGFKEMIKTKPAAQIHAILSELREWSSGDMDEDEGDEIEAGLAHAIAFSDNVVRVCPIDSEWPHGALFHELMSLVHVQAKLTERGVFLRGGITVDNIHIARGEVFGPGLVRAYELESKQAIYPRIVLDPKVLESYLQNPAMRGDHSLEDDLRAIDELLREGEDGLYFVDYLKACRSELNDPGIGFSAKLKEHAGYIAAAAAAMSAFSAEKQKYAWLARYHNQVVDETEDADDDCKVATAAIAFPSLVKAAEPPTKETKPAKKPKPAKKAPKSAAARATKKPSA